MILFLAVCLLPSLGMLLFPGEPAAANQNLAPKPSLHKADGSLNGAFLPDLIAYEEDHFALRQKMITANARLDAALFGVSGTDDVLLGKDGWLFYSETIPQRLHEAPLTDRQLFGAARALALMDEYCRERDARLLFTCAPNKVSIYPEYLKKDRTPLEGADDIDRLLPYLKAQGVQYADLFAPLKEADEVLYYRTDSHWTEKGAALAADTLADALGLENADLFRAGFTESGTHRGDLYEMVYPSGRYEEPMLAPSGGLPFEYARPIRSEEDQLIDTVCEAAPEGSSLLMFRDSFGNSLHRYAASYFRDAEFSRSMPFRMELVDTSQAKTVIIEIVERNLRYLSENAPVMPAPVRVFNTVPSENAGLSARLTLTETESPEGYVRACGSVSDPDEDSPIWLSVDGTVYEAFPCGTAEDGAPFTAYVPKAPAESIRVLCLVNGELALAKPIVSEPIQEDQE